MIALGIGSVYLIRGGCYVINEAVNSFDCASALLRMTLSVISEVSELKTSLTWFKMFESNIGGLLIYDEWRVEPRVILPSTLTNNVFILC